MRSYLEKHRLLYGHIDAIIALIIAVIYFVVIPGEVLEASGIQNTSPFIRTLFMLGFVKYYKLSMGHEKAQKVDGIFWIFSIYYVYYFYRHFNDYQIRINSAARKLS